MPLGRWFLILGGLFLAGCTTTYAVYKHPVTGDVMECEQAAGGPSIYASVSYAECKSTLARTIRERTRQRPSRLQRALG